MQLRTNGVHCRESTGTGGLAIGVCGGALEVSGYKSTHNFYTMLAVFSAEPDAQDSVMNSQDTNRVLILTECWHVAEVRHESSLCIF